MYSRKANSDTPLVYEANIIDLLPYLDDIVRRLFARGKINSDALVQPINSTHEQALVSLHAELPCTPEVAIRRLRGTAIEGNYCRYRSVVLTISGVVLGTFLVQPQPSSTAAFVYGVVIVRPWRGTWANAFLKHGALIRLHNFGTDIIRFQSISKDTHKHAIRGKACIWSSYRFSS